MIEAEINGPKKRSLSVVSRTDGADAQGPVVMLGLLLVSALVGWLLGIVALIFVQGPSLLFILSVVVLGALGAGAVLIAFRSIRWGGEKLCVGSGVKSELLAVPSGASLKGFLSVLIVLRKQFRLQRCPLSGLDADCLGRLR